MPSIQAPKLDDLREGESVSMSSGTNVGVEGSAEVSAVSVGGQIVGGKRTEVQVTRRGGKLEVTVLDADNLGGGVDVSAATIGAGGKRVKGNASHTTVAFDLGTPEGQAAYAEWSKNPDQRPTSGTGANLVSSGTGESTTTNGKVKALIGESGMASQTGSYTETLADGRVAKTHNGSYTLEDSLKVPTQKEHKRSQKYGITARTETDGDGGERTTWDLRSEIDSSTAVEASVGLANADGKNHYADRNAEGGASGAWTVEEELSDAAMQVFADKVRSGQHQPGLGREHAGDGEALRAALEAANGDKDKERAAIAQYVADGGAKSIRGIKECPGVESGKKHYTLKGDQYLTGREGHAKFNAAVARIRAQLGAADPDYASLSREARALVAQANAKRSQVGNPGNYPDLPHGARHEIVQEVTGQIQEAEALLGTIDGRRFKRGDLPVTADIAPYAAAQKRMYANRKEAEQALFRTDNERKMLAGYLSAQPLSARQRYSAGTFERADAAWKVAMGAYNAAQGLEADAMRIDPFDTNDGIGRGAAAFSAAATALWEARSRLFEARAAYTEVRFKVQNKQDGTIGTGSTQTASWLYHGIDDGLKRP